VAAWRIALPAALERERALGARVRGERARPLQVPGPLAQHPPEQHQVAVEVVRGLHPGGGLGEQHRERARVWLDVVGVCGQ